MAMRKIGNRFTAFGVAGGLIIVPAAIENSIKYLVKVEGERGVVVEQHQKELPRLDLDVAVANASSSASAGSAITVQNMITGGEVRGYLDPRYYGLGGPTDVSSGSGISFRST